MNIQITEDYVSFGVAKLLKEKGFYQDYYSYPVYWINGNKPTLSFEGDDDFPYSQNECVAPSFTTAMKWLREVHKIDIDITSRWNLTPEYHICEYRYRLHYSNAPTHDINQKFNSYEESCEAAIKYCLTNLI